MAPAIIEDDYYEILGVSSSASIDAVRQNYRRLALERHPDKNKNEPDATAAFQLLAEAFQTIKDPEKRREYDKIWPSIRDNRVRRARKSTPQREKAGDHNTEASAAHRHKAAKAREERLKRENEQRFKEQEAEKVRKAAEDSERQKIEKEMADRVREQIRSAREAERRRTEAEQNERRKAADAEADKLRESMRKMEESIRRSEEAQTRRMQAAEEERRRASEAKLNLLREEEERRNHIHRLESHRIAYEHELFEAEDRSDQLTIEIQLIEDLDWEDAQWKEKKTGIAQVLLAVDPSARAEHKRELQKREACRLERDATRRIKTSQLDKQELEVRKAHDRLEHLKAKIAAVKKLHEDTTQKEEVRQERTPYKDQAEKPSASERPSKPPCKENDFFGSTKQGRPPVYPRFPSEQAKKKTPMKEAQTTSSPPRRPSFAKSRRQTTDYTKDTWSPPSEQPRKVPRPRRAAFTSEPKGSTQHTDRSRSPVRDKEPSPRYFSRTKSPSPASPPPQSRPERERQRERSPDQYQSRRDSEPLRRAEFKKASSQYFARARSPSSPPSPPPRSFSYQDAPPEETRRERSPRRPIRVEVPPRRATYQYEPRKASSQYFDDRDSSNHRHYFEGKRPPSPIPVRPSPPPMPDDDISSDRDREPPRRDEYSTSSRGFEEKGERRDDREYDRDDAYYDSRYNSYENDDAIDANDIQILLNDFEAMLRRRLRPRTSDRGR